MRSSIREAFSLLSLARMRCQNIVLTATVATFLMGVIVSGAVGLRALVLGLAVLLGLNWAITGSLNRILVLTVVIGTAASGFPLRATILPVDAGLAAITVLCAIGSLSGFRSGGVDETRADPIRTEYTGMQVGGTLFFVLIGTSAAWVTLSAIVNRSSIASLVPWLVGLVVVTHLHIAGSSLLRLKFLLAGVLVGLLSAALFDAYLYFAGRAVSTGVLNAGRFVGGLGDYELSAEAYGLGLILALYCITRWSFWWTIGGGLLAVLDVTLLIATQSRSPLLLVIILGTIVVVHLWRYERNSRGDSMKGHLRGNALMLAFGLVIAATVVPFVAASATLERLRSVRVNDGVAEFLNRAGTWAYFTSTDSFENLGLLGNGTFYPYDEIGTFPHSLYLYVLWSQGWVGLALILIIIISPFLRLLMMRHKTLEQFMTLILGVYMLIDEVKIEAARVDASWLLFWTVIGLGWLATREKSTKPEQHRVDAPVTFVRDRPTGIEQ